jgi:hypothetical protein
MEDLVTRRKARKKVREIIRGERGKNTVGSKKHSGKCDVLVLLKMLLISLVCEQNKNA